MELIDKDALVAEIRKRLLPVIRDKYYDEWEEGQDSERIAILDIINTIEVKEVDLENYVHGTIDYPIIGSDFPNIYPNYKELKNYCDKNRIMDNDKVKLIIVKEDKINGKN